MEADKDGDGKLSFEEFSMMVANTVRAQSSLPRHSVTMRYLFLGYRETNDSRGPLLSSQLSLCFRAACKIYLLGAVLLLFVALTVCYGSMSCVYSHAQISTVEKCIHKFSIGLLITSTFSHVCLLLFFPQALPPRHWRVNCQKRRSSYIWLRCDRR